MDPPEVVVDIRLQYLQKKRLTTLQSRISNYELAFRMQPDTVRVLREEAVGMYEVAVLEAGSAEALKRWMTQHKYKYPQGMDAVCECQTRRE